MVTRLYGVANTAAPISPAFDANWQATTGAVRRNLSASKAAATETRSAVAVASGADNETLGFQLISAPLSAQTINGTVTIMTRGSEGANTDNINRRARGIRVVSNDGSVVRGTLLTQGFHSTTTELSTTLAGRQAANITGLTEVIAQDGDRIVVELGYGMSSTGTTPQYDMVIGGNGTDHANSDGDTTGTVPWIEFSIDLTFQPPSGEYTILTTQTPDTEDPASGQDRMLGLRFTSTHDGTVVRGRWYVGATATSAAVTALWQLWRVSDTTKLVEVDVKALGDSTTNGWIEFDVPDTAIVASTQYVVSRFTDDAYPFNYLASGTYPVTNGPLSADTSVFVNNLTSNDYPSNLEGTAMFFVDVVANYGSMNIADAANSLGSLAGPKSSASAIGEASGASSTGPLAGEQTAISNVNKGSASASIGAGLGLTTAGSVYSVANTSVQTGVGAGPAPISSGVRLASASASVGAAAAETTCTSAIGVASSAASTGPLTEARAANSAQGLSSTATQIGAGVGSVIASSSLAFSQSDIAIHQNVGTWSVGAISDAKKVNDVASAGPLIGASTAVSAQSLTTVAVSYNVGLGETIAASSLISTLTDTAASLGLLVAPGSAQSVIDLSLATTSIGMWAGLHGAVSSFPASLPAEPLARPAGAVDLRVPQTTIDLASRAISPENSQKSVNISGGSDLDIRPARRQNIPDPV